MTDDPNTLHVFGDDCEWVIAFSLDDAREVLGKFWGGDFPDGPSWDCWEQQSDDSTMTVWCDAGGKPTEPHSEGSREVTLTNREWCDRLGRGYLCTTEY